MPLYMSRPCASAVPSRNSAVSSTWPVVASYLTSPQVVVWCSLPSGLPDIAVDLGRAGDHPHRRRPDGCRPRPGVPARSGKRDQEFRRPGLGIDPQNAAQPVGHDPELAVFSGQAMAAAAVVLGPAGSGDAKRSFRSYRLHRCLAVRHWRPSRDGRCRTQSPTCCRVGHHGLELLAVPVEQPGCFFLVLAALAIAGRFLLGDAARPSGTAASAVGLGVRYLEQILVVPRDGECCAAAAASRAQILALGAAWLPAHG